MRLEVIYQLLKIKAEKLMENGDVNGYLKTLTRMNEIKVSLVAA